MKHIENSLHNVLYWWRCEQVGFSQLFFASIDLQHARQSKVSCAVVSTSERGFTARLVVCIGTLWHFFLMQKHKEWATETVLFVAWCIISWHHLLTARDMFLFSVWSLHWCCCGFAPKTCKPTGLKALNCPVLGIGGPHIMISVIHLI